jgi:hypothetical protein
MHCVPSFKCNVGSICFKPLPNVEREPELWYDTLELEDVLEVLSACSRISRLTIPTEAKINFDAIANSLPSLVTLECLYVYSYSGSLQRLNHIRTLSLRQIFRNVSEITPFLPSNSVQTLTHLVLDFRGPRFDDGQPIIDTEPLNSFPHLTSLSIGPLQSSICDFIIGSQIRLKVFEVLMLHEIPPIDEVEDMLEAKCLRNIERFALMDYDDSNCNTNDEELYWLQVFDAFTSILSSVKKVKLKACLHLQCCPFLARMTNLELLDWDGIYLPFFRGGTRKRGSLEKLIGQALKTAFSNFVKKPKVKVVCYE